jgi:biotin transporter BioY
VIVLLAVIVASVLVVYAIGFVVLKLIALYQWLKKEDCAGGATTTKN